MKGVRFHAREEQHHALPIELLRLSIQRICQFVAFEMCSEYSRCDLGHPPKYAHAETGCLGSYPGKTTGSAGKE